MGSTSGSIELTFTFDTSGTLASTPYVVLTQGAANRDFKAAATQSATQCITGQSYLVGATCTVDGTFTPTVPGLRIGAVQLMGSAGTPIATFQLHGTGSGPLVTFPSNTTINTLGNGFNQPQGVAVDGSGNVFVLDFNNFW